MVADTFWSADCVGQDFNRLKGSKFVSRSCQGGKNRIDVEHNLVTQKVNVIVLFCSEMSAIVAPRVISNRVESGITDSELIKLVLERPIGLIDGRKHLVNSGKLEGNKN